MAESILHVGGVTMRINGSGNLDMELSSLNNIKTKALNPFVMQTVTAIEPTRIGNFKSQRYSLEFSVDEINEYFVINRLVFWLKPIYQSYPSVMNR